MIDPLTAFAAVKGGIAAGKQLHQMSKEIAGFFDATDSAKKEHEKKKNSVFASANEEAMDTFMKKQAAIDAEAQLRELIVNTRGFSAYQELLKIRRDVLRQRKEAEAQAAREREEMQEMIAIVMVVLVFLAIAAVTVGLYFDVIDTRRMFR
jgi:hypothetical protein